MRAAVLDKAFFERLAIHAGHAGARGFYLLTCSINGFAVFLATVAVEAVSQTGSVLGDPLVDAFVLTAVFVFLQITLAGLVAGLVSAVRRRPVQPTAIAMFYAMAIFLPMTVIGVTLVVTNAVAAVTELIATSWILVAFFSVLLSFELIGCAWGLSAFVGSLRRAFAQTRFANG